MNKILAYLSIPLGPLIFFVAQSNLNNYLPLHMAVVMSTLLWMLAWWLFTQLPPAIPALLPFIIFSIYEILSPVELASAVGSPTILLFLGSFMISAAIEKWDLHKDFAILFIKRSKHSVYGLLASFIFVAAFASMWISNTATVLILLPVIETLFNAKEKNSSTRHLIGIFMLAIAYASSIGGLGTIIGSPPNAIAVDALRQFKNETLSFAKWMKMALPLCVMGCMILYFFFAHKLKHITESKNFQPEAINSVVQTLKNHKLVWNYEKISICIVLILCILAWLFAAEVSAITHLKFGDASIALSGGILMFLIPTRNQTHSKNILNFQDLEKLPWPTLFLFSGGIALSKGLSSSGWIELAKTHLASTQHLNTYLLLFVIVLLGIILTEVMSNTALAALLVPWAISLESTLQAPVLHIVFALCCASSLSFMMPVATPPNAIAFSKGYISLKEMLKHGFLLNIIFAVLITAYVIWMLPALT